MRPDATEIHKIDVITINGKVIHYRLFCNLYIEKYEDKQKSFSL